MSTDRATVECWLTELRSADASRRLAAAQAIGERKCYTEELISALRQIARADHFAVRQAADRALAALRTGGRLVTPEPPLPVAQAAKPAPARVAAPAAHARRRPRAQAPAWMRALRQSTGQKAFCLVAAGLCAVHLVLAPLLFLVTRSLGSVWVLAAAAIVMALMALERRRYDVAVGIVTGTVAAGLGAWLLLQGLQWLAASIVRSLIFF